MFVYSMKRCNTINGQLDTSIRPTKEGIFKRDEDFSLYLGTIAKFL